MGGGQAEENEENQPSQNIAARTEELARTRDQARSDIRYTRAVKNTLKEFVQEDGVLELDPERLYTEFLQAGIDTD